jgi:signal transduction histidine kinase
MAFALGALATATLFNLYRKQIGDADREIVTESRELEVLIPGNLPETIQWTLDPNMGWTVFDDTERMLRDDPVLTETAARQALSYEGIVSTKALGKTWRLRRFPAGPDRTIVVGYDMVKAQGAINDLMLAYAWSLPLVIIVVVAGSWWVTGRALAPFSDLTHAIEGIQFMHLERQQRVTVHPAKDEIQRLATSFNELLGRFEKSFAQTKRFAADASHELRTPLTIMKSEVERVLAQPDLPDGIAHTLVSLQDEIARLDRITEQLLQLARFDAGQIVLEKREVNYSELLAEACEDAELLALAANVTLEITLHSTLLGNADPNHLRRLFLNLLDNACKHNRPKGKVRCSLEKDEHVAVLRIGNTGPGIPAEMRRRVFERFFLADPSRPNARGHGLGLALCWEIVELHGGRLVLTENCAPDWTEFVVLLPTM